jgi:hypothetical protein
MAKNENSGIIDLRLSLDFHSAPDVHTLMYMTPRGSRRKLLIEAVRHYIQATGHEAGTKDAQLKAVASWLSGRGGAESRRLTLDAPQQHQNSPVEVGVSPPSTQEPSVTANAVVMGGTEGATGAETSAPSESTEEMPGTVSRWLVEESDEDE